MARGNIRGITIEIGGNTQKLQDSLKQVNAKSRDLQSELREVDRLLKLDPKNTELLTQKQKLLTEAVSGTKEKLDTLKEAERQVKEQFAQGKVGEEQYRAIQREVIKTQQELKQLEKDLNEVNSKWKAAADGLSDFGKKSEDMGKKLLPVSAVITGAGVASTKLASDFSDAMAKVSTIADTTSVPLETLRKEILELSNQTGISANEIANNVYDAISAGQGTADAVAFVANSTKLAKAGFAEAGQSLDILTTIMNAYGLESEKVGEVSDMLIQIQNRGKVTVGELSSVMGKIIPTANALGIGLDQVGAGYAILTSRGIKAAEATTYMNSMLNELSKSGSKSDKELRNLTGKSFRELISEGKSVTDVLALINENAINNGLSLSDMFGSAEAGRAALTLLGEDAQTFNDLMKDMQGSLGATQEAFDKLQTPGEQARISFNKIKNVMIELGDVVLPVLAKLAEGVGYFADKLLAMDDRTKTVVVIIAILIAAIGPLLIIIGKMAAGVAALINLVILITPSITALGPAFAFLTGPIGLVILAVTALIAIFVYLWNTNEEFRNKVIELWEGLKAFFVATLEFIKEHFSFAWEAITKAFLAFSRLFSGDFRGFLREIFNAAKVWVSGWAEIGKNIVTGIWDGIMAMKDWIFEKVTGFFGGLLGAAKGALGISSPSKVFADVIGKNMALGVGVGFEDALMDVKNAMGNSLRSVSQDVYSDNRVSNNQDIKVTQNIYTPVKNERALERETIRSLRKVIPQI